MESLPIYKINQFQESKRSGRLYANELTNHLKAHEFITKPHKHDFYLLILFTHGRGQHEIDFTTYPIEPGSLFVLKPGQVHNWKLSKDAEGYLFFHTKDYYDLIFRDHRLEDYPFFQNSRSNPHIFLKERDKEEIEKKFLEILKEYRSDNYLKYRKICSLLDITYVEITRLHLPEDYSALPKDVYAEKLLNFESLIEKEFKTLKSPKDYADHLNISAKHLNRICKSIRDKTTSELIANRVVLEARRLLVHGESNITEIASHLGYDDPSYFTRLFKKSSGETPSEFLNKYFENNVKKVSRN